MIIDLSILALKVEELSLNKNEIENIYNDITREKVMSITKTSRRIYKPKAYEKIIINPIYFKN